MTAAEWIAKRRELLDAATDGPWRWRNTGAPYLMGKGPRVVMAFGLMGMQGAQPQFRDEHGILQDGGRANLNSFPDAALIADARTSLPAALDALEAVLRGHRPVSFSFSWRDGVVMHEVCPGCQDKAGVHPCGCWRDEDASHLCAVCSDLEHRLDVPYPCMTVTAIETALRGES